MENEWLQVSQYTNGKLMVSGVPIFIGAPKTINFPFGTQMENKWIQVFQYLSMLRYFNPKYWDMAETESALLAISCTSQKTVNPLYNGTHYNS